MKSSFLMAIIGLSLFILFPSCNKDQDSFSNALLSTSEDMTTQQYLLEVNETEIYEQLDQAFLDLSTRGYPTRTWSQPKGIYPNTLTIDYGPTGVTGPHGHVRKGKLIIDFSASILAPGAVRTLRHDDFSIDNVSIEGQVNLTNQGFNQSGQMVWIRVVLDRVLTFPSGKSSSWTASQILTLEQGIQTPIRTDDVWSITGSASGTNREGKTISLNTLQSLVFPGSCRWIVGGILSITVNGDAFTLDYGDGSCNNDATLTLPDGSQQAIKIRRWW